MGDGIQPMLRTLGLGLQATAHVVLPSLPRLLKHSVDASRSGGYRVLQRGLLRQRRLLLYPGLRLRGHQLLRMCAVAASAAFDKLCPLACDPATAVCNFDAAKHRAADSDEGARLARTPLQHVQRAYGLKALRCWCLRSHAALNTVIDERPPTLLRNGSEVGA